MFSCIKKLKNKPKNDMTKRYFYMPYKHAYEILDSNNQLDKQKEISAYTQRSDGMIDVDKPITMQEATKRISAVKLSKWEFLNKKTRELTTLAKKIDKTNAKIEKAQKTIRELKVDLVHTRKDHQDCSKKIDEIYSDGSITKEMAKYFVREFPRSISQAFFKEQRSSLFSPVQNLGDDFILPVVGGDAPDGEEKHASQNTNGCG
jgi:hypothetical protein